MKVIKFLGLIIVGLVITSVTVSNHSLDDSAVVSELTQEIKSLERDNTVLRAEIASAGSLTAAAENIELAGFVPPSNIATLAAPGHVAMR